MTALTKYARLESGGIWREDAESQRRDVIVSFGDATLVVSDSAGRALTHWSLAAVRRINPGQRPALFTPDFDGSETLEIGEADMIDAVETVRKTVARTRPRPGRLRWAGMGLSFAMVAALAVFWLPDALMRQTMAVVPLSKRTEIGATLLGHVQALTGPSCRTELGRQALGRLQLRVLGQGFGGQIVVLRSGIPQSVYLPGGIILLNRAVVEDHEDPAVTAGYVAATAAVTRAIDPLEPLLDQAGLRAAFTLLTTGDLPPGTLRAYAEVIASNEPPAIPDTEVIASFAGAQISTVPYAYALDITGESTLGLIEADPMAGREVPAILSDGDWVALQGICGQ